MRLWHIDILRFLPKSQLLAQWRELNSIYKNQPKHLLIDYVYKYPKTTLQYYSYWVINEIRARGYKIHSFANFDNYFKDIDYSHIMTDPLHFAEHDEEYLKICYYNLREKYIRGQKDYSSDLWRKLNIYYQENLYD